MNDDKAAIDFESRSACSIRNHGSWRYSLDPTTEVLCMAFRLPYWNAGRTALWHPAFPHLDIAEAACHDDLIELMDWIDAGGLVEAHNAWFERGIWTNIMVPRYGWPAIPAGAWRCSAAKAAAHSIPRSLDDALTAMHLGISKDASGSKVMMKCAKPRKPRKKEREAGVTGLLWWENADLFAQLWAYCRQDVLAEEALSHALDDLNPLETEVYLLDQAINERGFGLDAVAIDTALTLIGQESTRLNQELATLTGGQVKKATQRAKMLDWFADNGLELSDTTKDTLDDILTSTGDLPPQTKRAVEIVRTLGRSSTAKYQAMVNWLCADGRAHGGLLYHGAGTGRWSGAGIQPQNFPKGHVKDMEALWADLKAGVPQANLMDILSQALRGAIVPRDGTALYVADYAAIEARVVMWLAEDDEALDIFRSGGDIYKTMAGEIYSIAPTAVDKDQRQVGKFAILGLGFQMGWSKFVATCETFGVTIEDQFAQRVVEAYRAKFWRVKAMWDDQQAAAIQACHGHPSGVACGRMVWLKEGKFLFCVLPSGRRLAYPDPQIRARQTPWGETRPALTFMGMNTYTRKWERQATYGGSLVENCLAEDTPVLTKRGWVRIDAIALQDRIWDGLEWVAHSGIVKKGWHETCILDGGLQLTRDHLFLTSEGWRCGEDLHQQLEWAPCRRPPYFQMRRFAWRALAVARQVLGGPCAGVSVSGYSDDGRIVFDVPSGAGSSGGTASGNLGRNENPVLQLALRIVAPLRRAGHSGVRAVAGFVRSVLGRHERHLRAPFVYRSDRQRWPLRANELPVGDVCRTTREHQSAKTEAVFSAVGRQTGSWAQGYIQPPLPGPIARVYDIMNCGPRNRFVVAGGRIVHNCTQAVARDLLAEALLRLEASGIYVPVLGVHDETICEGPLDAGLERFNALMTAPTEWSDGLPIAIDSWTGFRYRK